MSASPTSYSVSARTDAEGHSEIATGGVGIPLDSSWGADSPSGLPGPAELLASALAGCLLKGLSRARAMLQFSYESAEVTITAHRQDVPPRFTEFDYVLSITTTESEHRVELLHRNLQQFGTIYNTLAASCDVHGTVVAIAPVQHTPGE